MTDRETFEIAQVIVERHGRAATRYAAGRIDELRAWGSASSAKNWRRVAAAVAFWLADEKPERATLQ